MKKHSTRPASRWPNLVKLACWGLVFATGCATESRVRERRETQEIALDRLQQRVEETHSRLVHSARRLDHLSSRLDAVHETVEESVLVSQKAGRTASRVAGQSLITETLFADDSIRFASGSAALTADARLLLDLFAAELEARGGDFFVEIHGHTDRTGNETENRLLARERAERVRRYLHQQHGVPMPRMHVLSLGSEDPLEPAGDRENLARDRRVTLVVRR